MFKNSVFYGQGLPYRFIQATDAEKKSLVEDMLSLSWIGDGRDRAVILIKHYEDLQTQFDIQLSEVQVQLNGLVDVIESYDESRRGLRERIRGLEEEERTRVRARRAESEQQKVRWRAELVEVQKNWEVLLKQVAEVDRKLEESLGKERELQRGVTSSKVTAETERDRVQALVVKDVCPTCGRPIDIPLRAVIQAQAKQVYDREADNYRRLGDELRDLRVARGYLDTAKKEAEIGLQNYSTQMLSLSASLEEPEEETSGPDLSPLRDEAVRYDGLYERGVEQRVQLEQHFTEITGLKTAVESILKPLQFWSVGFSNRGLKAFVLSAIIPFLNDRAAYYSSSLTDGQVQITFSVESAYDRFMVIVSNMDSMVEYSQFSGGERRRVDVIVLLSLCDLIATRSGVDVNLRIFDEVCENLDMTGIEKIIGLFQELSEDRCVYVISHNSEFESYFNRFLQVKKDRRGVSTASVVDGVA
jgi:DNA repair exonuclease SbcCD ATPase subunit